MPGANLVQEQDVLGRDTSDIQNNVAGNTDGIQGETNGHKSAGGDSPKKTDNPKSIQEVEECLGKLKLDNNNGTDNGQSEQLDLKLEEIDLSNLREGPPIVLIAGDRREIRPYANKYTILGRYLRPATINKWAMVILFDEHIVLEVEKGFRLFDEVQKFANRYTEYALSKGISISHINTIQYVPSQPSLTNTVVTMTKDQLKSELHKLLAKLNDNLVDHALIILPENCPLWVHGYLQYLETTEWGSVKRPGLNLLTRTSRMRYETLTKQGIRTRDRGPTSLIPHVWLKYNTKLGGLNVALKQTFDTHELRFLSEKFLILGIDLCKLGATTADVAEPAFEGVDIAATVGMWDLASNKMSFRSETRAQRSNIAVVDIDLLVRDVIRSYKERKGGKLPAHIIIFRSVTHEHSVSEVAQQELSSIKRMLATECEEPHKELPSLTYLRVPKKKRISKYDPKQKNSTRAIIQTGSLVDSIMSDGNVAASPPSDGQPNEPNQPTDQSEPLSKYWKILKVYDEINLTSASVRAMVHSLSYLSPRVAARTRPTPVDLADLANERARHLSVGWLEDKGSKYKDDRGDKGGLIKDLNHFLTEEMGDENYKNTLYYA